MSPKHFDVIVIGSGPAGVQAASILVKEGLEVALFDIGHQDEKYAPRIPDQAFQTLRETDPHQRFYFLGEHPSERILSSQNSVAPHLTPPRLHMIREVEKLFPLTAQEGVVSLLQSSGVGGLGIGWGANCFEYDQHELERAGLPPSEVQKEYSELAQEIGVSGPKGSDISRFVSGSIPLQSPLSLDGNSTRVLESYGKKKTFLNGDGFFLGPSVLAVLTQKLEERQPNSYHDMDFWSDHGRSVYRPQFTLEKLRGFPNFTYFKQHLCLEVTSAESQPRALFINLATEERVGFSARRVVLAAGAINSGKIVLNSKKDFTNTLPFLCNRNHWIAGLNLKALGKKVPNERHSLSQLTAVMSGDSSGPSDSSDLVIGHFYSYRSLLAYRLIRELPFDPFISLPLLRLILSSLTVVNLHFSDAGEDATRLKLSQEGALGRIEVQRRGSREKELRDLRDERKFIQNLLKLWIVPLRVRRPPRGSSIHYAGTLPVSKSWASNHVKESGELWEMPGVFVADSSTWSFLPAKGLTFTLMANARRVARQVSLSLRR